MSAETTTIQADTLTVGQVIQHPRTGEDITVTWLEPRGIFTHVGYSVVRNGRTDTSFLTVR